MKKFFLILAIVFLALILFLATKIFMGKSGAQIPSELDFKVIAGEEIGDHAEFMEDNSVEARLIVNQKNWLFLWEEISWYSDSEPLLKAPKIDLSKSLILAVLHGYSTSCGKILIKKIDYSGGNIRIFVERVLPGESCYELGMIFDCLYAPYVIIEIPRYAGLDKSEIILNISDFFEECYISD